LPPALILDFLYCGNVWNAHNKLQLDELKIEYILSVRKERGRVNEKEFRYLHCPLDDYGGTNLGEIWNKCFNFICEAKSSQKRVLVHCDGGINRAPTVIVGYLMCCEHWTLKQAYEHVKQVRPQMAPRETYLNQLRALEKTTTGKDTLEDCSEVVETLDQKKADSVDILMRLVCDKDNT